MHIFPFALHIIDWGIEWWMKNEEKVEGKIGIANFAEFWKWGSDEGNFEVSSTSLATKP